MLFDPAATRARRLLSTVGIVLLAALQPGCGSSDEASGSGASVPPRVAKALERTLADYQDHLTYDVVNFAESTLDLRAAVEVRNISSAKSIYISLRGWFARISPAVALYPALELRIDGPGACGLPWLERVLWTGRAGAPKRGMRCFHRETEELRLAVEHAPLRPKRLVAVVLQSLGEIEPSVRAGRQERYADAGLVELAGTVEGVGSVFEALRAGMTPGVEHRLEASLGKTYELLGILEGQAQPSPEVSAPSNPRTDFPSYSQIPPGRLHRLIRNLQRISKLFSQASTLRGLQ